MLRAGMVEWREDLRRCLLQAGVKDTPTSFVFTDAQVVMESFLEDVNNILNAGDVRTPRPHAIDATRRHLTMPWVVSFLILSLWKASGPLRRVRETAVAAMA
jgi:hypothetical protein